MVKNKAEKIERVIVKLPQSVAEYFRKAFPHGKRSGFVARCILDHERLQEIEKVEEELKRAGRKRQ